VGRGNKLERFAQIKTFPNVLEPDGERIRTEDFPLRGNWNRDFFKNNHPISLELGCGKGEYTVGLATRYPQRNFIGIDIKGARMWKGAKQALEDKLLNVAFVRTRIEFIERIFGQEEVEEIWITFPDPYPKKPGNRLSSSYFIKRYGNIIRSGGLIHLKTDSQQLHNYTLAVLEESKIVPEDVSNDLYSSRQTRDEILEIKTYYEQVFLSENKPITYLKFSLEKDTELLEPKKTWG